MCSTLSFCLGTGRDAANKQVVEVLDGEALKWKQKRGQYHHYSGELHVKVVNYACESGNKAALQKYSADRAYTLSEAMGKNLKRSYLEKLKANRDPDNITNLPHAALGRPLLIGHFDENGYDYISVCISLNQFENHLKQLVSFSS